MELSQLLQDCKPIILLLQERERNGLKTFQIIQTILKNLRMTLVPWNLHVCQNYNRKQNISILNIITSNNTSEIRLF